MADKSAGKNEIVCPACGKTVIKTTGDVRRAAKAGLRLFCNRACSGLGRRKAAPVSPRNPNWKAMKKEYDRQYRDRNIPTIKAKKKMHYAKVGPTQRDKEREYRTKNMPRHVEYCRQPKYRKKKAEYDLDLRSRAFGDFGEAYKTLMVLQREILSRATRDEIAQQNGLLNKSTKRKDEYGRQTGNVKRR